MPKPTLTVYSRTLYAQLWTLNIALLRYQVRICEILHAADKRRYNVLSICPVAHPFTLAGFGMFDGAKLQLFPDIARKKSCQPKCQQGIEQKNRHLAHYVSAMLGFVSNDYFVIIFEGRMRSTMTVSASIWKTYTHRLL